MNFTAILDEIIRREGGFINHPSDTGGPTKYGITQRTLSQYRGVPASVDDVRNLTEDEARAIYTDRYIARPGFNRILNASLMGLIVDCGINHGRKRASKWLQKAVGVTQDGVLGPISIAAINDADGATLYRKVLAHRCRFFGRIITRDPSQAVFAAGWNARVAEFIEETP